LLRSWGRYFTHVSERIAPKLGIAESLARILDFFSNQFEGATFDADVLRINFSADLRRWAVVIGQTGFFVCLGLRGLRCLHRDYPYLNGFGAFLKYEKKAGGKNDQTDD
jgi:hypothetical protein